MNEKLESRMERIARKFKPKTTLIILAVLMVISLITLAYAIQVWSEPVDITVGEGYELTLNDPEDGSINDTFTFTGTLNNNGIAVEGATVTLYIDEGGGYTTTGLTAITDAAGGYSIEWAPLAIGTYSFKTLTTVS